MDVCIAALFYWGFGYAFAFGESVLQEEKRNAGFIGDTLYFYSANPEDLQTNFQGYAHMFFNFTFAAAIASIISGAIAERCLMTTYFVTTAFVTGFVYPVISHWTWSTPGWLCPWNSFKGEQDLYMDVGAIDFAGSGVVHICGGTAAAFGAWWIGARKGRFDAHGNVQPMPNHSAPMQVMGTLLIWGAWYGMTIGTMFTHGYSGYALAAGRIAMTTTLAAGAGAVSTTAFNYLKNGEYDLTTINMGILSGLVSVSAGCATMPPWAAVVTGFVAGLVYNFGSWLSLFLKIDDVVDAVAVHGWCGVWGCIAAALFSRQAEMMEVYGSSKVGLFYGGGNILSTNVVLICAVIGWTGMWMFTFFGACYYAGVLRVSENEEQNNIDSYKPSYDAGEMEMPRSVALEKA